MSEPDEASVNRRASTRRDLVIAYDRVVRQSDALLDRVHDAVAELTQVLLTEAIPLTNDPEFPANEAVKAAEALTTSVTTLTGEVAALHKGRRHNQVMIRVLAAVVAVEFLLVLGLGGVARRVWHNSSAVVVSCRALNQSKANEKAVWDFAFHLSPDPNQTPEQRRQTEQFKAFLNTKLTPERC